MYDFIEGQVVSRTPAQVVVAAGGVGYRLIIPLSTFDALSDGGPARLLVHHYVREDDMRLYGFATEDERRLFTRLIAVSNVGPNTALAVLNGMRVDDFRRAAANEDLALIVAIKGIGRKTAERIVLELKAEMGRELLERPAAGAPASTLTSDAVSAMLALGYRRSAAERAIRKAFDVVGRDATLEEVVKQALQEI
jgi:Holliday junction DNA helicase RuvA